jgi:hypothetical protein
MIHHSIKIQDLQETITDQEKQLESLRATIRLGNREDQQKLSDAKQKLSDVEYSVSALKVELRKLDPILKDGLKNSLSISEEEIASIKKFIEKALHDAQDGIATESIKPYLEALLLQRGEALTEVSFVKIDGKWRSTLSYVEFEELPDYTSYTPKFFSSIKNRVKVHSVDAETLVGSISGLKEPPPKKSLTSRYSRH